METCLRCKKKKSIELGCGDDFCICLLSKFDWYIFKSVFICPECDEPVMSMEIDDQKLDLVEVRLMTMLNSYMYGDECSKEPLSKENLLEGLNEFADAEFADEDDEIDWLWQEIGLCNMQELFKLLVEFAEKNYEWVVKLKS